MLIKNRIALYLKVKSRRRREGGRGLTIRHICAKLSIPLSIIKLYLRELVSSNVLDFADNGKDEMLYYWREEN